MCTALFWFRLISEALRAGGLEGGGGVRAASAVHHAHQYAEGSSSKKIAPFYRPITETGFTGGSWSEHRWIRKVRSLDYHRIWYCRWRAWESSVLCVGGLFLEAGSGVWGVCYQLPQRCSIVLRQLPWARAETQKLEMQWSLTGWLWMANNNPEMNCINSEVVLVTTQSFSIKGSFPSWLLEYKSIASQETYG